jgi:hypothetical protein
MPGIPSRPSLYFLAGLFLAAVAAASADTAPAPGDLAGDRQLLLQRWSAFCDTLKAAGERIVALDRGQPINTTEGFHYLAMLTGMGIERVQGYEIPSHPQVARSLDTYKKIGLDSSDNTYRIVRFEPGGVYRIRGWRGNSTYLGFQLNEGISAVANLNDDDMQFNDDGSFELYLGGERRAGNWLDAAGHREGVIYYRWNQAERAPGAPLVKRIKLAELPGYLPPDTPMVTPAERAEILRQCAEDVARRFAL